MGKTFELWTDRDGLKHLFENPNLNARQRSWIELLCEYEFDIKHIKGKENKVVDALSRKMHVMHVAAINTSTSDLKDKIIETSVIDELYQQVKEGLKQQKIPQKFDKYKFQENGILMHRDRVYVPDVGDIRKMVLKETHNVLYREHPGYRKK